MAVVGIARGHFSVASRDDDESGAQSRPSSLIRGGGLFETFDLWFEKDLLLLILLVLAVVWGPKAISEQGRLSIHQ